MWRWQCSLYTQGMLLQCILYVLEYSPFSLSLPPSPLSLSPPPLPLTFPPLPPTRTHRVPTPAHASAFHQPQDVDSVPGTPVEPNSGQGPPEICSFGHGSSTASLSSEASSMTEGLRVASASLTSAEAEGAIQAGERRDKGQSKGPKKERLPRILLKKIDPSAEGTLVHCWFDTHKNSRIAFEFGIADDEPEEIAANMVMCPPRTRKVVFRSSSQRGWGTCVKRSLPGGRGGILCCLKGPHSSVNEMPSVYHIGLWEGRREGRIPEIGSTRERAYRDSFRFHTRYFRLVF